MGNTGITPGIQPLKSSNGDSLQTSTAESATETKATTTLALTKQERQPNPNQNKHTVEEKKQPLWTDREQKNTAGLAPWNGQLPATQAAPVTPAPKTPHGYLRGEGSMAGPPASGLLQGAPGGWGGQGTFGARNCDQDRQTTGSPFCESA